MKSKTREICETVFNHLKDENAEDCAWSFSKYNCASDLPHKKPSAKNFYKKLHDTSSSFQQY